MAINLVKGQTIDLRKNDKGETFDLSKVTMDWAGMSVKRTQVFSVNYRHQKKKSSIWMRLLSYWMAMIKSSTWAEQLIRMAVRLDCLKEM